MKKKDTEEDSFDPRVQTPSHVESTDDEDSDEEIQGANVEGEELDEEETNEEDESSSVSSGFVSNMLNPSPDTGIDSIFNLNTESTSLVDVPVTTIAEPRDDLDWQQDSSLTRTHSSHHTSSTNTSSHTSNYSNLLPTRSSQLCIVDAYLANKMHKAVKTAVQLQSDRLRDEAQAENKDFINKLDNNIKKIIKDQDKEQVKAQVSKILPKIEKTVNEQLEAEVLTRSSNESKTSHAVAANLSKLELKKILIDKMESNKSIHRSDEQKNLYKALVDAYESDKLILDTYGDTVSFKRRRDDEDKDKEPFGRSNQGSKRRRAKKELESINTPKEKTSKTTGKSTKGSKSHHKSAQTEEPMHTAEDLEEPTHQEFVTGDTKDKPDEETSQHPDWFQKPAKPPTPDRDWNKTLPAAHGPVQPWLSTLAQKEDNPGPTFDLMKGSCKSLVKLEYFFEEVYKATTDQLDGNNPEGQQYPHDLRKPLPLIPNSRGRQVIPFNHFINNNLAYLNGGVSSQKYTTSVTKTKAADYGHIKWIEDLVPNRMWSQVPISYDKHALWGISHWGRKQQQFYRFAVTWNLLEMSTPNAESLL
ncbi:hypothetical protein Tco_0089709 [Tanacetum coccineum]